MIQKPGYASTKGRYTLHNIFTHKRTFETMVKQQRHDGENAMYDG